MPNVAIVNPTPSYAALSGNQPATIIDASYSTVYAAENDLNRVSNYYVDTNTTTPNNPTLGAWPAGLVVSISAGLRLEVLIGFTNTGASTLHVPGNAQSIVSATGTALVGGELVANRIVVFEFNGPLAAWQIVSPVPIPASTITQPTRQIFITGTGTYTTPAGVKSLFYRIVGPGGGAAGSGTSAGAGNSGVSSSAFGAFQAGAGNGGATNATTGLGGLGGNPVVGTGWSGGDGQGGSTLGKTGGMGGANMLGGGGAGAPGGTLVAAGRDGKTNTGAGGGGAGGDGTTSGGSAGGGAGSVVEGWLTSIAATYTYTVGLGGLGGTAGTAGAAGGAGAAGIVIVDEFYI